MDTKMSTKKRQGISPVIATVILVAVAITVAVAVSYWMSGIAGQYTSFEKVAIKSAYASRKYDTAATPVFQGWVISIKLQNTGSSLATLESLFVNEKPIIEYGFITGTTGPGKIRWIMPDPAPDSTEPWATWQALTDVTSVSLDSGDEATIYVLIFGGYVPEDPGPPVIPASYGLFSPGTTINVKFHSAGGLDYIRLVQLT